MTELLLLPFSEVVINRDATERTSLDHADAQPTHQLMATGQQNDIIRVSKTNNTLVVLLAIRVRTINALPLIFPAKLLPAGQKSHPRKYSASESAWAHDSAGSVPPKSTRTAGFLRFSALPRRAASRTSVSSPPRSPSTPSAARAAATRSSGSARPGRAGRARSRRRRRGPTSR